MKYYSVNNKDLKVSFKQAVLQGLADDSGLFMPEKIPVLPSKFFKNISSLSFHDISYEVANQFIQKDIPLRILKQIIDDAFNFDIPLVQLKNRESDSRFKNVYVLELFHGPTLAFKDFAARFMARVMSYFIKDLDKELTVLVATSGDTGSAVANGFLKAEGIKVIILYPSGKVSEIQEKQLTTMGNNITALEIKGTFDDCQELVKQAFVDKDLNKHLNLTSANSINIARLIPQSFYYFYAYAQSPNTQSPIIFSVPSGNFGNLTAGLMAKKMGLSVAKFIASSNINDSVQRYLQSGEFKPESSKQTISNAMDVGAPSNFIRMLELYNHDVNAMRKHIYGASFTDKQTKGAIVNVYKQYGYILDPHGAVGYLGLKNYTSKVRETRLPSLVFLETAHPAKFLSVVQSLINKDIHTPEKLKQCFKKKKRSMVLLNKFEDLKSFLLS